MVSNSYGPKIPCPQQSLSSISYGRKIRWPQNIMKARPGTPRCAISAASTLSRLGEVGFYAPRKKQGWCTNKQRRIPKRRTRPCLASRETAAIAYDDPELVARRTTIISLDSLSEKGPLHYPQQGAAYIDPGLVGARGPADPPWTRGPVGPYCSGHIIL